MDYLGLVKQAVGLVVSFGVGSIVKNVIENTTPNTMSALNKLTIGVSGIVLSMMVSDAAVKFTDTKIDEMSEKFVVSNKTV